MHCVYHSGAPGHDVENSYPLKTKVQDLVRSGILCFKDVGPNVKKNPLPEHGKSAVNMVQGCPGKYKVKYVSHIRQSLVEMHRLLCEYSHYEHDHDRCRVCTVNQRGCRQVRKDIQEMLDEGVIEILQNRDGDDEVNVISPVFRIPEPVVIRYDGSKQKASPSLIIKPARPVPYSSDKAIPYRYNVVALEDGKEVPLPSTSVVNIADASGLTRSGRIFSTLPKPGLASEGPMLLIVLCARWEILLLLRIRHLLLINLPLLSASTNAIKDLCTIFAYELRTIREALQKVLDVAYVDHDVTIEQFDSIVANITACNNMSFCDVDLPEEGRDHNLALHISMSFKDDAMSNVLVDTGSSLNVLPKSILARLSYQGPPMRPWIHEAGAVTSTLHQKLKFVKNKKLVVVGGEKALLKGTSSFASYNDAKLAIEHGTTTDLGQMIKMEDNKSRASIGYSSGTFNKHGLFQSGGFIHTVQDEETATIVKENAEEDSDNFVIPGGVCNNWVVVDVPTVVHKST
ncbi:hypothetical protein KIW84_072963 [Lathyrus oleraceus]|uniref:Peptidase A2 domain-containing protein n=1 Tax=Pisum sativum TaxID=3888 RepID=A0A9D4ZY07_PEA|nr:hypothetical protein KIW84_072963 [Pisum sativum]